MTAISSSYELSYHLSTTIVSDISSLDACHSSPQF